MDKWLVGVWLRLWVVSVVLSSYLIMVVVVFVAVSGDGLVLLNFNSWGELWLEFFLIVSVLPLVFYYFCVFVRFSVLEVLGRG